ncbi:MAG: hypothetical protein ACLQHK_14455 [Gallionellaceae bacterium]
MKRLHTALLVALLAGMTTLQGCAFVVGAAVGGTTAYVLHENGYRVRSPVSK